MCFPRNGGFGGSTLILARFGQWMSLCLSCFKGALSQPTKNRKKTCATWDSGSSAIDRKWLLSCFVDPDFAWGGPGMAPGQSRTDPARRGCAWVPNPAPFLQSRSQTLRRLVNIARFGPSLWCIDWDVLSRVPGFRLASTWSSSISEIVVAVFVWICLGKILHRPGFFLLTSDRDSSSWHAPGSGELRHPLSSLRSRCN